MNTIPITFNERKVSYTILGKTNSDSSEPVSVVILNRGGRIFLPSLFKDLLSAGLNSIIYVDKTERSFEVENLANEFPEVKFILPFEELSIGEMINLGMSETSSSCVMVLWSDINLPTHFLNAKVLEKLDEPKTLCITPGLRDSKDNKLPVQIVPSLMNMEFSFVQDFIRTLYAFDFMGIYSREKFIKLGGFDYTISNPYWQNLDFAFRANLWSYNFLISNYVRMNYGNKKPFDDISADESYMKFYLKNLAPVVDGRGAYLPKRLFFSYVKKSGLNPIKAYKYFSAVRNWVNINKTNFIQAPQKLISEWEPII